MADAIGIFFFCLVTMLFWFRIPAFYDPIGCVMMLMAAAAVGLTIVAVVIIHLLWPAVPHYQICLAATTGAIIGATLALIINKEEAKKEQ